jgi:hypothetical protein
MTETIPTNTIRHSDTAEPDQPRPQAQEDLGGPSGPQADHSQVSSQSTAPGRRPLFRK